MYFFRFYYGWSCTNYCTFGTCKTERTNWNPSHFCKLALMKKLHKAAEKNWSLQTKLAKFNENYYNCTNVLYNVHKTHATESVKKSLSNVQG